MIYITGDTHGDIDFSKLNNYFKTKNVTYDDILIILGDAGIVWSSYMLEAFIKLYESLGLTILYLDGNHENHKMLNAYNISYLFNAKVHQISKHIYHVLRGEILKINKLNILCLGGAHSIDRATRLLDVTYWEEEEISNDDVANAITNLEKVNYKVDLVLTHCADSKTVYNEFGFERDLSSDQLMFIDKLVTYKKWFFGHYHQDVKINNKKRCFYQDIVQIAI